MPLHSKSFTAEPSGGGRCCVAPQGSQHWIWICATQQENRWKRRKLPTAVKLDEVVQDSYVLMVNQVEKEKIPNGCKIRYGCTYKDCLSKRSIMRKRRRLLMAVKVEDDVLKHFQLNGGTWRKEKLTMVVKWMRLYKVPPVRRKLFWQHLGGTESSALAGSWPRRDNCDMEGLWPEWYSSTMIYIVEIYHSGRKPSIYDTNPF